MELVEVRNGRIAFRATKEEVQKFSSKCLGKVSVVDNGYAYTVDDNLMNRFILNMDCSIIYSANPSQPYELDPRLREYQKVDVQIALSLMSSLNRNRMGYGKTIEAIATVKALKVPTILVVCPKSVRLQWEKQFKLWADVDVYQGIENAPKEFRSPRTIVVITNYEQLYGKHGARYQNKSWGAIIADEIHRIKNRSSKRTQALERCKAIYKLGLSGTPIRNRPDDLYSILHWLNPMYSGRSYWAFVERFCKVEENFYGKQIVGLTTDSVAELFLHRILDTVAISNPDLKLTQPKQHIDVPIEMTSSQKSTYKKITKLLIDELREDGITVSNGLSKIMKLQQLLSNPATLGVPGANPKFEWIKDVLECNPELKLVVYSRFSETIDALQEYLGEDICTIYIGRLDDYEREESKQRFFNQSATRVMAGTIGALGEGVDGLQDVCYNVVFIDKTYDPHDIEQAEDRVNRPPQPQQVNVFTLIGAPIDEKIGRIHLAKIEDIRRLFNEDSGS